MIVGLTLPTTHLALQPLSQAASDHATKCSWHKDVTGDGKEVGTAEDGSTTLKVSEGATACHVSSQPRDVQALLIQGSTLAVCNCDDAATCFVKEPGNPATNLAKALEEQ